MTNAVMEWATIEVPFTSELSSTCTCSSCDNCGAGYTGATDKCSECDEGELQAVSDCWGECWQYINDDWEENLLPEFLSRIGDPQRLKIEGTRMGWQSRSGWLTVPAEWEALRGALSIKGDYTLRLTLAGDTLKVQRYSHDEPTGATFTIVADTSPVCGDCLVQVTECGCIE